MSEYVIFAAIILVTLVILLKRKLRVTKTIGGFVVEINRYFN